MKISRDGLLMRWAYLFNWSDRPPKGSRQNLCELFWGIVGKTILVVSILFVIGMLAVLAFQHFKDFIIAIGLVTGIITVICAGCWWSESEAWNTVKEGVRGFKENYCPRLEIK